VEKLDITRDWFTSRFYKCLPLTIANTYGFSVKADFDFSATWSGTQDRESTVITGITENKYLYPKVDSRFGSGIVTLSYPFQLRTPTGVNLMTINPPNIVIPNVTVMSGVIETDNLRRDFTFNLKLTRPNHKINIKKGDLIGCVLPIPRYFPDSFEVANGRKLFTEDEIRQEEEMKAEFYEYETNFIFLSAFRSIFIIWTTSSKCYSINYK
jgi:hypothetical protein